MSTSRPPSQEEHMATGMSSAISQNSCDLIFALIPGVQAGLGY